MKGRRETATLEEKTVLVGSRESQRWSRRCSRSLLVTASRHGVGRVRAADGGAAW